MARRAVRAVAPLKEPPRPRSLGGGLVVRTDRQERFSTKTGTGGCSGGKSRRDQQVPGQDVTTPFLPFVSFMHPGSNPIILNIVFTLA
jgi:hypothetical protein